MSFIFCFISCFIFQGVGIHINNLHFYLIASWQGINIKISKFDIKGIISYISLSWIECYYWTFCFSKLSSLSKFDFIGEVILVRVQNLGKNKLLFWINHKSLVHERSHKIGRASIIRDNKFPVEKYDIRWGRVIFNVNRSFHFIWSFLIV